MADLTFLGLVLPFCNGFYKPSGCVEFNTGTFYVPFTLWMAHKVRVCPVYNGRQGEQQLWGFDY
jgi:hypothetical protein